MRRDLPDTPLGMFDSSTFASPPRGGSDWHTGVLYAVAARRGPCDLCIRRRIAPDWIRVRFAFSATTRAALATLIDATSKLFSSKNLEVCPCRSRGRPRLGLRRTRGGSYANGAPAATGCGAARLCPLALTRQVSIEGGVLSSQSTALKADAIRLHNDDHFCGPGCGGHDAPDSSLPSRGRSGTTSSSFCTGPVSTGPTLLPERRAGFA
jgi:hypothetical protein